MGERNKRIRRKIRKIAFTEELFSSMPCHSVAQRLVETLFRKNIPLSGHLTFIQQNFPSEEEMRQRQFIERL